MKRQSPGRRGGGKPQRVREKTGDGVQRDMAEGKITIYTGGGHGKTPAALGIALQYASEGKRTVMIQFLKGKGLEDTEFVKRLEPEIRIFRFEKSDLCFDSRSEQEKQDDLTNIRNGLQFARKELNTGGCDLLILDEVLDLVANGIITVEDLRSLLEKHEYTDIILTGVNMSPEVCQFADVITKLVGVQCTD